ncbi:pimeloyl-ACP methyl ester carboxylesterase [Granulicella aggregans]|uniref:Pimeloyl-ACP methyl ester carboxylesterase n=1 Tax=Granulicella aggregans TaxID=474949 RepID=A0A7W7ZD47_9BACT|nr:alpha/beta fold hydrolase [Granulicella aggregans]MBB5057668.1 pimeloyl-ACP methyl ester carboxylesterase [Granulicella aggregans]
MELAMTSPASEDRLRAGVTRAAEPSLMEDRYVEVAGAQLHYHFAGSGRPLLLLHGLVGSGSNWRQNIGFLSRYASVYAIDLFNMGESERVPGLDASLEATADRIVALMEALGLESADIAAHSHGGAIAMMLAARHPDRVRKLILFAPANPFCDAGRHLIRFYNTRTGQWFARRIPMLPRMLHATALGRMYGDPARVTEGTLETYTDGMMIPGTVEHVLRIVAGWYDDMRALRGELIHLAGKPALFIWGDRDRAVTLPSGERLRAMMPMSKLIVMRGAGHLPFAEMADECNTAMVEWLVGAV